jgi:hypothetical protein
MARADQPDGAAARSLPAGARQISGKTWRDRFSRWLIRHRRQEDFAGFSQNLIETFDDGADPRLFKGVHRRQGIGKTRKFRRAALSLALPARPPTLPHNVDFVKGLLRYYRQQKMDAEWRELIAAYYFESPELRLEFLDHLARSGEIRVYLARAETGEAGKSELEPCLTGYFAPTPRAWLSDFETAAAL